MSGPPSLNTNQPPRVAIVGSGVAGLLAAKTLQRRGIRNIHVFDKGDTVGGRVRTDTVSVRLENGPLNAQIGVFQLDRGFQILLTGYPAVKEHLDLKALGVKCFGQGAVLAGPANVSGPKANTNSAAPLSYVANPLTCPKLLFATIKCAIFRWGVFATLRDVFQIVVHLLVPWIRQEPYTRLRTMLEWERDELAMPAGSSSTSATRNLQQPLLPQTGNIRMTTAYYLEHTLRISAGMRQEFLRPFFEAIYVSSLTQQSPAMFDFVLRALAFGGAALPTDGIGAVPRQLMDQILSNCKNEGKDGDAVVFHFGAAVEKIESSGKLNNQNPDANQETNQNNSGVYSVVYRNVDSGDKPTQMTYDAVIMAVEEPAVRQILGEQENNNDQHGKLNNSNNGARDNSSDTGGNSNNTGNSESSDRKTHTRSATFYFALPEDELPVKEPLIVLQRYRSMAEGRSGEASDRGSQSRICNVGFPSVVQRSYAPQGYHLAAVTVAEIDGGDDGGKRTADGIAFPPSIEWVLQQVAQLLHGSHPMPRVLESWTHIRTYSLDYHQPLQVTGLTANGEALGKQNLYPCLPEEARLVRQDGIVTCGDYTSHPTLDGAMQSGVQAATLVADRIL